jgi:hypothetical protein
MPEYCTYGYVESNFTQNSLFSRSKKPIKTKNLHRFPGGEVSKRSIQYQKGINFSIKLSGSDHTNFENYMGKASLNLNRCKKSTDPSDVGTLAFDA